MSDTPVAHLNLKSVSESELSRQGEDWLVITLQNGKTFKLKTKDLPLLSSNLTKYDGAEISGFTGETLNELLAWLASNSGGYDALNPTPINVVANAFDLDPATLINGSRYLIGTSGAVDGVWYQNGAEVEVVNGAFVYVGDNPYNSDGKLAEVVAEEALRIAGDKYNGTNLGNNSIHADDPPNFYEAGVVSRSFIFGGSSSVLNFPTGGEAEVNLRYSGGSNYALAKMTFRSYNGAHDLVKYSANAGGTTWTDWEQNLTLKDGAITSPVSFDINPTAESAIDFSNPESVVNVDMIQTAGALDKSYGDTSIHRRIAEYTVPVGTSTIDFNLVTLGIPPRVNAGASEVKMSCKYYPTGSYHSQCKSWLASIGFSVLGYAYFISYQTVTREFNAGAPKITFDDLLTEDGTTHSASNTTGVVKIGVNNAHTTPFKILLDIEVTHLPT